MEKFIIFSIAAMISWMTYGPSKGGNGVAPVKNGITTTSYHIYKPHVLPKDVFSSKK